MPLERPNLKDFLTIATLKKYTDSQVGQIKSELEQVTEEVGKELSQVKLKKGDKGEKGDRGMDGKDGVNGINGLNGKDGVAGLPGASGFSGSDGLDGKDGIDGKDGSPDTPTQVRDKLELLKKDERLSKSAIKGLDNLVDQPILDRAVSILDQRTSFLINKVSNLQTKVESGIVNETDPLSLHLDQTTPQTIVNGIPLLTGLTPTTDYQLATKKYVDDSVVPVTETDPLSVHTTGGTMTGELIISPTNVTALRADGNVIIRLGSKLIFDG